MSTDYPAISAIDDWSAPGLAPRRTSGLGSSLFKSVAAALRRNHQMLQALQRSWRQRPVGNGGPPAPKDEQEAYDSIWDDPLLWMLMMH